MFSVDTSTIVAFLAGAKGPDIEAFRSAVSENQLLLTPPVLAEILSDVRLPGQHEKIILSLPVAKLKDGFWERVGYLRREVLKKKRRARLADALISQCCIDHGLLLIARDADFRNFAIASSLKVVG